MLLLDDDPPSETGFANDASGRRMLRVLVVSEDALARTGLALLLSSGGAGAEPTSVVDKVRPHAIETSLARVGAELVVWDLGADPERASATLASQRVEVPLIVLVPDGVSVAAALADGVLGVLGRNVDGGSLVRAAHAVAAGLVVLDAALAAPLVRSERSAKASRSRSAPALELTPREREVLESLAEGLANKTIAARLHISEHTVKFHVNAILAKLGADSRTDAVVRAARLGLVML